MKDFSPLERRVFKLKHPTMSFFCPLCRTERAFSYRPQLSQLNFLQIILLSVVTIFLTYSLFSWRAFFIFFCYWFLFEGILRLLFKREVPCPHCGFDAIWYKRDVKVARQRVKDFWPTVPTTARPTNK